MSRVVHLIVDKNVFCFFLQFRDDVYQNILTSNLPNLLEYGNITALTHLWASGQITNFEYLTHLNKHAGRSFNDLMQYPVFPFILSDYTNETLDLTDPTIYRCRLTLLPSLRLNAGFSKRKEFTFA